MSNRDIFQRAARTLSDCLARVVRGTGNCQLCRLVVWPLRCAGMEFHRVANPAVDTLERKSGAPLCPASVWQSTCAGRAGIAGGLPAGWTPRDLGSAAGLATGHSGSCFLATGERVQRPVGPFVRHAQRVVVPHRLEPRGAYGNLGVGIGAGLQAAE